MGEAMISRRGGGTSNGGNLNIFAQTTQPTAQNGLWIKSNEVEQIFIGNRAVGTGEYETSDATLPAGMFASGVAATGSLVYVFGGRTSWNAGAQYTKNTIYKYDTTSDTINACSTVLPMAKGHIAACAVGSVCYLFGGSPTNYTGGTSEIYAFDANTEVITTVANLPRALAEACAATVGNKCYVFGGNYYNSSDGLYHTSTALYIFDSQTKVVTTSSVTFTGVCEAGIGVIGNECYVVGGRLESGQSNDYIQKFNTATNVRTNISLSNAGNGMAVGVVNDELYLFGGIAGGTGNAKNTVQIFNTTTNQARAASFTLNSNLTAIGYTNTTSGVYLFGGVNVGFSTGGASPSTQISKMVTLTPFENGTAIVSLSEASDYETILYQTGTITLQPKIGKVLLQKNGKPQEVAAAILVDGEVTNIS